MVLRKPYAFLIKHFRLIHLILTGLLTYVVLQFGKIYGFLNKVIENAANRYDALSYINNGLIIYIILIIVICGLIYWLLKYKDKPRRIYIFTIAGYIIVTVFMMILFNYMNGLTVGVGSEKTIRLYRDLLLIILFFQYYIIIVMGIRGLGFDIKKFNFGSDVQELNLNETDGEEVEVNLNIDATNVIRGIRKQKREFGYFFKEFKWYIIIIIIVIISFLGYKGYNFFVDKYKAYSENDIIGDYKKISIKDSYYMVDGDNNYVIINFDIYNNGLRDRLNTGNISLNIGKNKYSPDKTICYKFSKLGNCYKTQFITSEVKNYILVYKVDNLNIQKAYILYNESYENDYKVKLVLKEYKE